MNPDLVADNERSVLRWGGLAGMLGAVLLLIVFGIVGTFVGPDPATPDGLVARFPGIRGARIVENGLYLAVVALWLLHVSALDRALRGSRLAPALFGRVLASLGLVVLAVGAIPHIATTPISDIYQAPGATPEQQAALVPLWLATQGLFDALLVTGLLVLPLGVMAFGLAMRTSPAYGAATGWLAVGLGAIGFASAMANLVEVSEIAAIAISALILFNLVVGWKTFRLSRRAALVSQPGTAMLGAQARS